MLYTVAIKNHIILFILFAIQNLFRIFRNPI